jgi:hypothetical protein
MHPYLAPGVHVGVQPLVCMWAYSRWCACGCTAAGVVRCRPGPHATACARCAAPRMRGPCLLAAWCAEGNCQREEFVVMQGKTYRLRIINAATLVRLA